MTGFRSCLGWTTSELVALTLIIDKGLEHQAFGSSSEIGKEFWKLKGVGFLRNKRFVCLNRSNPDQ